MTSDYQKVFVININNKAAPKSLPFPVNEIDIRIDCPSSSTSFFKTIYLAVRILKL